MEHILIPHKRAAMLDSKTLEKLEDRLGCSINVNDNEVTINGKPYDEYNAKNVVQAFGRGFALDKAFRLLSEDYFFQQVNLKEMFRNPDQLARVKARLIGTEGRAKEYIESVSGVDMMVYGNTVSTIGRIEEVRIADAGIKILIGGGKHKTAYAVMEKERRKIKEEEQHGKRS
jgi:ribosomal RNA assembly protein